MHTHRRTRAFVAAFLLTLCVLMFLGALLLADINTRRVTFSNATLPYATAGDHALTTAESVAEHLPVTCQPLWWLFRMEQTVLGWLLEI